MTFTTPNHGLPGRFLLKLAHRLASATAYERVFVPLLADYQFEYRQATSPGVRVRVRLKWILAFGQTLGLEAVSALAEHLRTNAWGTTEEERSFARRLFARVAQLRPCAALPSRWTCSGIPSAGSSSTEWVLSPSCCRERSAWHTRRPAARRRPVRA